MKAKCAALLAGMLLLGVTRAEATTYAVSEFFGSAGAGAGEGIGGSITTDGTLGPIGAANIVDWNLIGTVILFTPGEPRETAFFDLTGPLSGGNSSIVNAVNITASPNALTLGVASGVIIPNGDLHFEANLGGGQLQDIEWTVAPGLIGFRNWNVCDTLLACTPPGGIDVEGLTFADGKVIPETPTTPLPAALPLFATGIGGLGLLGWRRKRRAPLTER